MSTWKIYPDVDYYFITTSVIEWIPIFIDQPFFSVIIESLTFCKENKGLNIHAYVIMMNHIHLIVSSDHNISDIMRDFKSFTSKKLTSLLKEKSSKIPLSIFKLAAQNDKKSQSYKVWQSGFHPIGIDSGSFFKQKFDYIHDNPIKKGYVTKPEHWFYSSARNYAGLSNYALEVDIL